MGKIEGTRRKSVRWAWVTLLVIQCLLPGHDSRAAIQTVSDGSTMMSTRGVVSGSSLKSAASVNSYSGSMSYEFPLLLPPGTGGLTPQLSLQYSSSGSPSSWVGVGWRLGLPSVVRTLRRGIPAYDETDGFELGGEELVLLSVNPSSRVYATRTESFQRIVHFTQVDEWVVTDRGGIKSVFGRGAGRIQNDAGLTFEWLLVETEDTKGNIARFTYDSSKDPGTAYLSEVRYGLRRTTGGGAESIGGNSARDRVVRFNLEDREDVPSDYRAGFLRSLSKRLASIDVFFGAAPSEGNTYRSYRLSYKTSSDSFRSLLLRIEEYGFDAFASTPTPPRVTAFEYGSNVRDGRTGWENTAWSWPSGPELTRSDFTDDGVRLGDVDGDGLPDLIKAKAEVIAGPSFTLSADSGVYLNRGDGFKSTRSDRYWPFPQEGNEVMAFSVEHRDGVEVVHQYTTSLAPVDFNGDGRVDFAGFEHLLELPGDWDQVKFGPLGASPDLGFFSNQRRVSRWAESGPGGFIDRTRAPDEGMDFPVLGSILDLPEIIFHDPPDGSHDFYTDSFRVASVPAGTQFAELNGDGFIDAVVRSRRRWGRMSDLICRAWDDCRVDSYCDVGIIDNRVLYGNGDFSFRHALNYQKEEDTDFGRNLAGELHSCIQEVRRESEDFQVCPLFAQGSPLCDRLSYQTLTTWDWAPYRWMTDTALHTDFHFDELYFVAEHQNQGNLALDLNADGLSDWVSSTRDEGTGWHYRWAGLNNGKWGYDADLSWALPEEVALQHRVPFDRPAFELIGKVVHHWSEFKKWETRDQGVRFADLNGDGRLDIIKRAGAEATRVWLNDGDVDEATDPSPWVFDVQGFWTLPEGIAFLDDEGQDLGVRLLDVNGDAMPDLLRSQGAVKEVYLNRGRVPDLMEAVTSTTGARTTIEYAPSTHFDNSGDDDAPDLPQVLQLVTRLSVGDGRGNLISQQYRYDGGYFDPKARVLRGFARVVREDAGGTTHTAAYHQGLVQLGLEGRAKWTEIRDAQGRLWERTEFSYLSDKDAPYLALLVRRTRYAYDGSAGAAPRVFESSYEYDYGGAVIYGNPTRITQHGEPFAPDRVTTMGYTVNEAAHILNRLARLRRLSPGHQAEWPPEEIEYHYDDHAGLMDPPKAGNLTRIQRESWGSPDRVFGYSYDEYGNSVEVLDARSMSSHVSFDDDFQTFPVQTQNPLGHLTKNNYAVTPASCPAGSVHPPLGSGLASRSTDANGAATELCYDAFGRVVGVAYPDGSWKEWQFTDYHPMLHPGPARVRILSSIDQGKTATHTIDLDRLGRSVRTVFDGPGGIQLETSTEYDFLGRLRSQSDVHGVGQPALYTSFDIYDTLGRVLQTTAPGKRVTTTVYAAGGVTVIDPNGNCRRRILDVFGDIREVYESKSGRCDAADAAITTYDYDYAGRLVRVTPAVAEESAPVVSPTLIRYDGLGQKIRIEDPDTGVMRYTYDGAGDLLLQTQSRLGQEVTRATSVYDALGRLERSSIGIDPDPGVAVDWDVFLSYDKGAYGIGRLGSALDDTGTHRYGYDEMGRLVSETHILDGRRFEFNQSYLLSGQLAERNLPGSSLHYEYDSKGFLVAVTDTGTVGGALPIVEAMHYDENGRLSDLRTSDGLLRSSRYDPATGRLARRTLRRGSLRFDDLRYAFDLGGRLQRIDDLLDRSRSRRFSYDGLDRLSSATGPFGLEASRTTLRYEYDGFGNLTLKDGLPRSYGENEAGPHALTSVGSAPLTYDLAGNLDTYGARDYDWDARNRLSTAREDGKLLAHYRYDYRGRRTVSETAGRRRYFVTPDFEFSEGEVTIHVFAAGERIASRSVYSAPLALPMATSTIREPDRAAIALLATGGLVPPALLLLWLALCFLRDERGPYPVAVQLTAALILVLFWFALGRPSLAAVWEDRDGDGVSDEHEQISKTDPDDAMSFPADADGDGVPDLLDWDADGDGLANASDGDTDNDGLSDDEEAVLETDPWDPDSDGDGLRDGAETLWGSNPLKSDTDGDGLSDALEAVMGLAPDLPDSDDDGLEDCVDAAPADPTETAVKQVADGDLNRDCHLDVGDALLALRSAHGLITGSPVGDVAPLDGGDGTLDLADALVLLRGLGDRDLDGDGVSAAGELAQGLSPFRWDSDGDGLSDTEESAGDAGGPNRIDRDGDGFLDIEETLYGTDRDEPDTDGDGIPDAEDARPTEKIVFYHGDHLGGTTMLTNIAGQVLSHVQYKPFGEAVIVAGSVPEFGFTGQRFERDLGIYDYGARFYDPALGRFLSPDTFVPGAHNPQALNRYSYVLNNPLSYTDPTGNLPTWDSFWGGMTSFLGTMGRGLAFIGETTWRGMGAAYNFIANVPLLGLLPSTSNNGGFLGQLAAMFNPNEGGLWRGSADGFGDLDESTNRSVGSLGRHNYVGGMLTSLREAFRQGFEQTRQDDLTVFDNPTHGFLGDFFESAVDLFFSPLGIRTGVAQNLQSYLGTAGPSGALVTHSQGVIIAQSAMRGLGKGALSGWSWDVNGSPVNHDSAWRSGNRVGIQAMDFASRRFDFASTILGRNATSFGSVVGSLNPFNLRQHNSYQYRCGILCRP